MFSSLPNYFDKTVVPRTSATSTKPSALSPSPWAMTIKADCLVSSLLDTVMTESVRSVVKVLLDMVKKVRLEEDDGCKASVVVLEEDSDSTATTAVAIQ